MEALATADDVISRLGRDLTTVEEERVDALLVDASSAVRGYTGRTFTTVETTARLRVQRGRVRLPQRPVIAIVSIHDLDRAGQTAGAVGVWSWNGLDELYLAGSAEIINGPTFWGSRGSWGMSCDRVVEIVYQNGYASIPDAIVAVTSQMVIRALGRKPEDSGLMQESIEGYSYQAGSAGAAMALGMLPDERALLDIFKTPATLIWTGR